MTDWDSLFADSKNIMYKYSTLEVILMDLKRVSVLILYNLIYWSYCIINA